MKEKLLTIREASQYLGISEKEVIELAHQGKIPAYKIGGIYLRFKREQLEEAKRTSSLFAKDIYTQHQYTFSERLKDIFYFYDFYFLAIVIIGALLFFIFNR